MLALAGLALTLVWTEVPLSEGLSSLGKRSKLLMIPALLILLRNRREAWYAVVAFLVAQLFLLLSSWLLVLHVPVPWATSPDALSAYSVFSSYLDQSIMSAVLAAVCWHLRKLSKKRWLHFLACTTALLALINVIFVMHGRTGHAVAVTLISLSVMWALPKRWRIAAMVAPFGLVLMLNLTSVTFHNRLALVVTETTDFNGSANYSTSSGERLNYWHRSLQAIAERPLIGFGVGSWNKEYQRLDAGRGAPHTLQVRNPHQEFLLWGVEAGVVGIALLCYLLLAIRHDAQNLAAPIRHSIESTLVALVVACCFNSSLFDGAIGDFFCVTLGLLLALGWYRAPPALSTMASGAEPIR